ncbi:cell wall protein [Venturia nashicola]|uniref:Cell wall protein n=1 Tax=Venturia nashicola TaxID=86259 RepID=A0A4Z1PC64_9PEZI|nr:cell wall protein [Venturia nashicola]TLD29866.1 cell wall protein [Venturia nashicola]
MQFKQIIALALAGTAIASPIQAVVDAVGAAPDLAVITGAFTAVEGALNALDTSIKALATGAGDAATKEVVSKSNAVKTALDDGATKIGAAGSVSITEALTVQGASTKLTSLTGTVITDLIGKKDIIVAAKQQKTTLESLNAQKASAEAFVKAITGKVPAGVQSIAAAASKSVGDSISKGITAFS